MSDKMIRYNNKYHDSQRSQYPKNLFPAVKLSRSQLKDYDKIPISSLAALGGAFYQLPETARTIVSTSKIATGGNLYYGINPKGVEGTLQCNAFGINGNIMGKNTEGKNVIRGRMAFKKVNSVSVNTEAVMPYDPTLLVIAVAMKRIESKLNAIQEEVEKVLRFLELDKKARQRGNLRLLTQITEDYKRKCDDKVFCMTKNGVVQSVMKDSLQDINFYSEEVTEELKKKKLIHSSADTKGFVDSVISKLAEYQLACYLYGYSTFLDVLLGKDFETESIESAIHKMTKVNKEYQKIYDNVLSRIAKSQREAIESQVVGGIGNAFSRIGKTIGSIPIVKKGPIDEALIGVGHSLKDVRKKGMISKLEMVELFQDNKLEMFRDSLRSVDMMYNERNSMLTDGKNLYIEKRK